MSMKKLAQLGMPIGTASNRLRKIVMLELLRELKKDRCIRCLAIIRHYEDLSIDHKAPWLDVSRELFWDPRNIGFSHKRCNAIARRSAAGRKLGPSIRRKIGPVGMAWCTGHAEFLALEEFCKNRSKWAGVQSFCKSCTTDRYGGYRPRERLTKICST